MRLPIPERAGTDSARPGQGSQVRRRDQGEPLPDGRPSVSVPRIDIDRLRIDEQDPLFLLPDQVRLLPDVPDAQDVIVAPAEEPDSRLVRRRPAPPAPDAGAAGLTGCKSTTARHRPPRTRLCSLHTPPGVRRPKHGIHRAGFKGCRLAASYTL